MMVMVMVMMMVMMMVMVMVMMMVMVMVMVMVMMMMKYGLAWRRAVLPFRIILVRVKTPIIFPFLSALRYTGNIIPSLARRSTILPVLRVMPGLVTPVVLPTPLTARDAVETVPCSVDTLLHSAIAFPLSLFTP